MRGGSPTLRAEREVSGIAALALVAALVVAHLVTCLPLQAPGAPDSLSIADGIVASRLADQPGTSNEPHGGACGYGLLGGHVLADAGQRVLIRALELLTLLLLAVGLVVGAGQHTQVLRRPWPRRSGHHPCRWMSGRRLLLDVNVALI